MGQTDYKLPRVLVGFPCGGSLTDSGFAESFSGALVGHGELFWAEQCWVHGGIPDDTRNEIAKEAIRGDYDFVFFMDVDMVFPKAALAKLLQGLAQVGQEWPALAEQATVIGGVYVTRSDHRLNVYSWDRKQDAFVALKKDMNTGVHRCDFVATGCQLIDVGVFEALDYPYFEYWYKPWGTSGAIGKFSEDATFAKKCFDKGIPHFAHTDVQCGHIHSVVIWPADDGHYQIRRLSGELYNDGIRRMGE
jgi:hypothetical protein